MQKFYKDIKKIKWCRLCGKEWRPRRYSWQDKRCICPACVYLEIKTWRKKNPEKWNDIMRRYKKKARPKRLPWVINAYEANKKWVSEHRERRREIDRDSYYRRKKKH